MISARAHTHLHMYTQKKPPLPAGLDPSNTRFVQTIQDPETGAIFDEFAVIRQVTQPVQQVEMEEREVTGMAVVNGRQENVSRTIQIPKTVQREVVLQVEEILQYERKRPQQQYAQPQDLPSGESAGPENVVTFRSITQRRFLTQPRNPLYRSTPASRHSIRASTLVPSSSALHSTQTQAV